MIAVVTVACLVAVWRSRSRADLEGFAGFAIPAAGIAAGWIAWVWRHKTSQGSEVVSGQELGRLADLLAGAVEAEWTRAAGERGLLEPEPIAVRWRRPAGPLAGPAAAAIASPRFVPLPGLAAAGEQRLQAGQVSELHEVFGGLGSGRLVIAGGPGAGKSGAAVLLILAALRYRRGFREEARPEVPVPVMFTLHGWDPGAQRARDWLAERLWQTYPLFAGRQGTGAARGMLDEGRIAVILDGLDEIPEDLRPAVLRALSQQATFRLVLLTRSAEMADAAARAVLQGAAAIELQDIAPGAAADYLTRTQLDPPPHGWQELTHRLRQQPGSPLAQALSNPLMLTLVRDTYRAGDDIGGLLGLRDAAGHPASSQDIADYLLDRVLPAAYTPQPGEPPPRYDLPAAERALRCIAARMNEDSTRDLQWWHAPAWAHAAPRFIATWFGAVLAFGLLFGLLFGLSGGLSFGLSMGLLFGLGAGIVAGIAFGRGNKMPKRMTPLRWRQLLRRRPLVVGLLAGTVAGTLFRLTNLGSPPPSPGVMVVNPNGTTTTVGTLSPLSGDLVVLRDALGFGLVTGFVAWLGAGLVAGMSRPGTDNTSPLSPLSSWRSDRAFGRVAGLVFGLVFGLSVGLLYGLPAGLSDWLVVGLSFGLPAGLVAGITVGLVYPQTWSSSLAFAQLAASDSTPVRLMRFLEDARSRSVLRTVGPVYQFRHARLQDRLAGREPATAQGPGDPARRQETLQRPQRKHRPQAPGSREDPLPLTAESHAQCGAALCIPVGVMVVSPTPGVRGHAEPKAPGSAQPAGVAAG